MQKKEASRKRLLTTRVKKDGGGTKEIESEDDSTNESEDQAEVLEKD